MILSSLALGVSLLVTLFKCAEWFLKSDAATLVRAGKWVGVLALLAAIPGLVLLLVFQQWTGAMVLGAALLAVPAFLNWRALLPRQKFRPMWREGEPPQEGLRGDFGQPPPDPELARRAAIVLEDYLVHAGYRDVSSRIDRGASTPMHDRPPSYDTPEMGRDEALDVLGLEGEPGAAAVRAAHRRLMQMVHPDKGGSTYLASKINQAKDVLLAQAARKPPSRRRAPRKPSKGDAA
ncbi:MAG: hypothetical protein AB1592_00385 [Pseudomonadota bacterium]